MKGQKAIKMRKQEIFEIIFLLILSVIFLLLKAHMFTGAIAVDEATYMAEGEKISLSRHYAGNPEFLPYHGPLFFYLSKIVVSAGSEMWLIRIIPSFFSFMTILLVYLLVKKRFGIYPAVLASLTITASPSFNIIGIFFSPHVFYIFFSLLSVFLLLEAVENGRTDFFILSLLFAAVAVMFLIIGIALVLAEILYLLVIKNRFISVKERRISKSFILGVLAFISLISIISPSFIWGGQAFRQYASFKDSMQYQLKSNAEPGLVVSLNFARDAYQTEHSLGILMILGFVFLLVYCLKERKNWIFGIYVAMHCAILFFTVGWFVYSVFPEVIAYIFLSAGIAYAASLISKKNEMKRFICYALIFIALSAVLLSTNMDEYIKERDVAFCQGPSKEIFDYISEKGINNTQIAARFPSNLEYYLKHSSLNNSTNLTIKKLSELKFDEMNNTEGYVFYFNAFPRISLSEKLMRDPFLKKVNDNCFLEKNISDPVLNDKAPSGLFFNCNKN